MILGLPNCVKNNENPESSTGTPFTELILNLRSCEMNESADVIQLNVQEASIVSLLTVVIAPLPVEPSTCGVCGRTWLLIVILP